MTTLSHPSPMEIDSGSQQAGTPKRQISNLSEPKKKSGVPGACSNLVNSIVGAGIIGIPFALKESGLIAGVVLLVLVSVFTGKSLEGRTHKNVNSIPPTFGPLHSSKIDKSLRMLVEMATFHPKLKGHGVLTFEDLMMLPYGSLGHHYVLGAMLITAYGAMVAYLLIVKDTLVSSRILWSSFWSYDFTKSICSVAIGVGP